MNTAPCFCPRHIERGRRNIENGILIDLLCEGFQLFEHILPFQTRFGDEILSLRETSTRGVVKYFSPKLLRNRVFLRRDWVSEGDCSGAIPAAWSVLAVVMSLA
jgi:hypothetical protein